MKIGLTAQDSSFLIDVKRKNFIKAHPGAGVFPGRAELPLRLDYCVAGDRHESKAARIGIGLTECEAARQHRPTKAIVEQSAFTLLEVMLAIAIFFMAMFAILGLLTSGVRAASMLRNNGPTAGMILAQLSATNVLASESKSGNFRDVPIYDGYEWSANIREMDTNGLFQIDAVVRDSKGNPYSVMSALLYRPDSEKNNKMGLQQQPGQR